MFQDFGISPGKFLIQTLIFLSLAILATVRVLRCRRESPHCILDARHMACAGFCLAARLA